MAETFPFSVRTTRLGIVSGLTYGRDRGGLIISSRQVEPYWSGTFSTAPLTRDDRAEALAFLDDCVDRNLRVDFIHPLYRYPVGYTSATWPLGLMDAALVSVTNLRTIVVSGLQVGSVLRKGSRLSLIQGSTICYRKVTADVTVSSTIAQSLSIGPRLPPGIFVADAAVRFAEPYVRMIIVPESWEPDEDIEDTSVSWEMMETLA